MKEVVLRDTSSSAMPKKPNQELLLQGQPKAAQSQDNYIAHYNTIVNAVVSECTKHERTHIGIRK